MSTRNTLSPKRPSPHPDAAAQHGQPRSPRLMMGDDDVPRVWALNHKGKMVLSSISQALNTNATRRLLPTAEQLSHQAMISGGHLQARPEHFETLRMLGSLRQFLTLNKVQASVWKQMWASVACCVGAEGEPRIGPAQLKSILARYLGVPHSPQVAAKMEQLFWAFPKKEKASMSAREFEVGIKIFERGTVEQKAAIFFYMADDDQGGYLSRSELLDALEEQGTVGQGSIDLVEQLFKVAIKAKEVVGEGKKMAISLQGFLRAVKECPEIGSYLGLHKYKSLASWER